MGDEIDVMPLYDDGGDICELFAKGHVERVAFMAEAVREWPHLSGGVPFVEADVEHVWRRAVPDWTGDRRCVYVHAEPGSRGAFRATVIDIRAPASTRPAAPSLSDAPEGRIEAQADPASDDFADAPEGDHNSSRQDGE